MRYLPPWVGREVWRFLRAPQTSWADMWPQVMHLCTYITCVPPRLDEEASFFFLSLKEWENMQGRVG